MEAHGLGFPTHLSYSTHGLRQSISNVGDEISVLFISRHILCLLLKMQAFENRAREHLPNMIRQLAGAFSNERVSDLLRVQSRWGGVRRRFGKVCLGDCILPECNLQKHDTLIQS